MKKATALFLALFLSLSLCACGGRSLADAEAKADDLLAEWTDKNYNYFYYAPIDSEAGHYNVLLLDNSNGDPFFDQKDIVDITAKELFHDLKKCFRGHDVKIGFIVAEDADNILYVYTHDDLEALK